MVILKENKSFKLYFDLFWSDLGPQKYQLPFLYFVKNVHLIMDDIHYILFRYNKKIDK